MNTASTHLPSRDEIIARRERLWGKPVSPRNLVIENREIERLEALAKERSIMTQERRKERIERLEKQAEASRAFETALIATKVFSTAGIAVGHYPEIDLPQSMDKPSFQDIALAVLDRYPGITLEVIKSASRIRPVVEARRAVIATIRKMRPDASYPAIGRFVCKDHSSCVHAVQKHEERWTR